MQIDGRHYLAQIEGLNQRGGRTLSIVDLIEAGTISSHAAAHVGHAVSRGASFLTAANPGGAGKTALLAALLGFLPPERHIVTVDDGAPALPDEAAPPACYLAHEVGDGHVYGYLWGAAARRYLSLAARGHTVASCLHADTLQELYDVLTSRPLDVGMPTILDIDFILFLHMDRADAGDARGYRRRVAAIYQSDYSAGEHRLVFQWDPEADVLEAVADAVDGPEVPDLSCFLRSLTSSDVRAFADVRQAYLSYAGGHTGRG